MLRGTGNALGSGQSSGHFCVDQLTVFLRPKTEESIRNGAFGPFNGYGAADYYLLTPSIQPRNQDKPIWGSLTLMAHPIMFEYSV